VFDLLEGKNTELTEAKIAQYRMQNEDQIAANQAKQVKRLQRGQLGLGVTMAVRAPRRHVGMQEPRPTGVGRRSPRLRAPVSPVTTQLRCAIEQRPGTRAGRTSAHPVWKERGREREAERERQRERAEEGSGVAARLDRRALPRAQAEEEMAAVMQRNGEQTPTSKGIHDDRRSSHTPANGQVRGRHAR
jgi:hypothetical protein